MGMTFVTEDEPDLTIPEDTLVRAKLLEIKPKTINWTIKNGPNAGQPASKAMLEWWWEITDTRFPGKDGLNRRLKAECEAKLTNNAGNKFRQWAEALLGREVPVGMGIDTDDVVGLSADVTVRHEKSSKPGDDRIFERIEDVIPLGDAFRLSDEPPF